MSVLSSCRRRRRRRGVQQAGRQTVLATGAVRAAPRHQAVQLGQLAADVARLGRRLQLRDLSCVICGRRRTQLQLPPGRRRAAADRRCRTGGPVSGAGQTDAVGQRGPVRQTLSDRETGQTDAVGQGDRSDGRCLTGRPVRQTLSDREIGAQWPVKSHSDIHAQV